MLTQFHPKSAFILKQVPFCNSFLVKESSHFHGFRSFSAKIASIFGEKLPSATIAISEKFPFSCHLAQFWGNLAGVWGASSSPGSGGIFFQGLPVKKVFFGKLPFKNQIKSFLRLFKKGSLFPVIFQLSEKFSGASKILSASLIFRDYRTPEFQVFGKGQSKEKKICI